MSKDVEEDSTGLNTQLGFDIAGDFRISTTFNPEKNVFETAVFRVLDEGEPRPTLFGVDLGIDFDPRDLESKSYDSFKLAAEGHKKIVEAYENGRIPPQKFDWEEGTDEEYEEYERNTLDAVVFGPETPSGYK